MPVRSLFDLVDRQRAGDSRHSTGIYTIDVFVFRGIPHGGVVLVSVNCASFEETLAPVRQTLRVSWLSVISTPPAVEAGWSFDRTSSGRTRYFCLRDWFLYETRLWIGRATYINPSRARASSVKPTTNSSERSYLENFRSHLVSDNYRYDSILRSIRYNSLNRVPIWNEWIFGGC